MTSLEKLDSFPPSHVRKIYCLVQSNMYNIIICYNRVNFIKVINLTPPTLTKLINIYCAMRNMLCCGLSEN